MSFRLFLSMPSLSLLCLIFMGLVKSQSDFGNPHMSQPNCSIRFSCGSFTAGYPFWGDNRPSGCGHPDLMLHCGGTPSILINGATYIILKVDEKAQTLKIRRWPYEPGICGLIYGPYITDTSPIFYYDVGYEMTTVYYDCPVSPSSLGNFTCFGRNLYIEAGASGPVEECGGNVTFPVSKSLNLTAIRNSSVLDQAIEEGFQVKWIVSGIACEECKSDGSCGYDVMLNQTICYCPNGQSWTPCPTPPAYQAPKEPSASPSPGSHIKIRDIFIGLAASLGTGIMIIVSVILIVVFWKMKTENDKHIEAFVTNYGSLARKRYNYSDVKRMTKSFSDTLGHGGYGNVYKGKLPDGCLVAVKVLKESKGNGEEFINEVASISRTSHVNIVTLLGFCCEKNKRALVYEFMPNGSLDKFIYDPESSCPKHNLEWKIMYQIAVGIARGLDYLHRGCNTRIVHFDIKPHNILLDEDFCPKISDFGLAKQSNTRESIISMLEARGTVGYIAPEVFCKNFGGVSHKSDVYSYGMMILEMVGGRNGIDVRPSQGGDMYSPQSIYKYLERGNDFVLHGVVTEEEKEIAKKMIFVSLWCIQTFPSDRPSMTKVVEMLEGSLEKLQIPPKPSGSPATTTPKHVPLYHHQHELVSREGSYTELSDK